MRRLMAVLFALTVPVSLTGCGTVCNLAMGDPQPYGGVQKDAEFFQSWAPRPGPSGGQSAALGAAACLGIPSAEFGCSFVGDTLTLPAVVAVRRWKHPEDYAPEDGPSTPPLDNPVRDLILEYQAARSGPRPPNQE